MQKTLIKEAEDRKYAYQASHILRRVSISEAFLFFTEEGHYTGKFAPSLVSLLEEIENAPLKSIEFHFERGDFQRWIRNILEDDDLASRIDSVKGDIYGNKLRKTIQNIVKERVSELKREMWLVQNKATRLERTNLSGRKMIFGIDLLKIEGEGEVICPKCREILSPNETLGMTYEVLDSKTSKDGFLEEAFIQCKKCESIIRLQGFEMLKET